MQKGKLAVIPSIAVLLLLLVSQANSGEEELAPKLRKKRYVVFPEGSSFSIALCMTVHTLTPDNIFTEGLNWGISYDLPNESKPELEPLLHLRKDKVQLSKHWQPEPDSRHKYNYPLTGQEKYYQKKANYNYLQRRHRRDLYNKIEVIIDAMGFHGRSCVLRALCEASQRFIPKGNSLIEEMIRIVFSLPLSKVFSFEPSEHHTYSNAHKSGYDGHNCPALFPECSFSLIDMALGKYKIEDDLVDNTWSQQALKYIMK